MFKKILSSIFIVLMLAVAQVAAADLGVSNKINTTASGNPDTTISGSFVLTNNGAAAINNIALTKNPLTGSAGTISSSQITVSPSSITTLAPGRSQTVTFSIAIPSNQAPGLYTGLITASDGGSNVVQVDLQITVNAISGIDVTTSEVSVVGESGDSVTGTFTVKNTGNSALASSSLSFTHSIDLTDADGDAVTVSFTPQFTSLSAGQTGTVNVNANIGNDVDVDTYSGTVTATTGSASDTFSLSMLVQPEVCSDGIIGNLKVDIKDPDNGDDFKPGETMNIEVKVDNDDDDDLDVVVEAILYNVDQDDNLEEVESDSQDIDSDDSDTFDLDLTIPSGDDSVNEDDQYILFVKAYDDGNEDEQCGQDSIEIELKREDDDVQVEDVTASPSIAVCGESVDFTVDVINAGSNDQDDVYVELKESALDISERSDEFDLDDGDSNDNDARKSFNVVIPADAQEKSYLVEAIVHFDNDDKSDSKFFTLQVKDCNPDVDTGSNDDDDDVVVPTSKVLVEVLDSDIGSAGQAFSLPIRVTNNDNRQQSYMISLENIADWAEPVADKTLTLNPGQSSTLYFYVSANEDAQGKQSATVDVKTSAGAVLSSETFTVDLGEEETDSIIPSEGVFSNVGNFIKDNSTVFWIIGDIILVIIVLVFLKFLFSRRK